MPEALYPLSRLISATVPSPMGLLCNADNGKRANLTLGSFTPPSFRRGVKNGGRCIRVLVNELSAPQPVNDRRRDYPRLPRSLDQAKRLIRHETGTGENVTCRTLLRVVSSPLRCPPPKAVLRSTERDTRGQVTPIPTQTLRPSHS